MSDGTEAWPVDLCGVTETVVATRGPTGRWNLAALGLFAEDAADEPANGPAVTATTWGRTRTRGNFEREGEGYVQFTADPLAFVETALTVWELECETDERPLIDSATAWVRVRAERADTGTDDGTEWVRWRLAPLESGVLERTVPTLTRASGAVVEASVAASRLGVAGFDDRDLERRLEWCREVVERTGCERERAALERVLTAAAERRSER
ncbi:DUF447 domain-containing protein [Natronobiforma cellulositropha]|uniref:DUF447 domain-containing protein n=1 Tax=Natronobiforma cellulositropha TaxID=1679076 RepID=UPI0021D6078C|nr:DUF447 domain-containing protein [Natronobiforma cellulositropha]